MTASLPMYDTPATRQANDRLWAAICKHLDHPHFPLDRTTDPHDTWNDPDLVLSQTCGLPYRTVLHGNVGLVGTPDYGIAGCPPGYYRSCVIARADDPRSELTDFATATLARNDIRSQSGWAAIWQLFTTLGGFDGTIIETGAHAASAAAVAQSRADIAAIDAVTWALLCRDCPDDVADLRVLLHTEPTPGLPLITSVQNGTDHLYSAVSDAIAALSSEDRECLMLHGLVAIAASAYLAVPTPD